MANSSGGNAPPSDFAQTTPRDLHPTSDIRFVMVELGKLTANVDSLISSQEKFGSRIDKLGEKIDSLEHKVTFVKGAIWVIGPIVLALAVIAGWYFTGKLSITIKP